MKVSDINGGRMRCINILNRRMVLCDRDIPELKTGEVLVKVHAAGANRLDILQQKGLYPPPQGVTDIPGLEIAGEVVANAGWGKGIKIGKKVCALVAGGGYAEYCAVPVAQCLPIPDGMEYITAAGIPETFFTVWTNFFDTAKLKKGSSVLVHGGASGIGTTAIQIARTFGIKIYVTAGTDDKCEACRKLGATLAVNYKDADFVPAIMNATNGFGVDAVIDMVGGDYVGRNLKVLKIGGIHISIAMQKNRMAEIDIAQVMTSNLRLTGTTLRGREVAEKGAIAEALLKNVWPLMRKRSFPFSLFSKKPMGPIIDKTFKLADAHEALQYLEAGTNVGKVILQVI